MAKAMIMPKIGVNITEAQITRWLIAEGDYVDEGQPVFEAETDKAIQEISSTTSGTIAKILAEEGDTVKILEPIAIVAQKGETVSEEDIKRLAGDMVARKKIISSVNIIQNTHIKISPLAKKIANQMGIDYALVKPEQEGARICKDDILRYSAQKESAPAVSATVQTRAPQILPIDNTRRTIMKKMTESNSTKPTVPLTLYADMTRFMKWRSDLKNSGNNIGTTVLIALSVSRVLKDFSMINSCMAADSGNIEICEQINIGIAADTEKGLMVPVIHECDKKGALQINAEFNEKIERIKSGKIEASDISGGTFTVSNLGMFEIECFAPIINPPECCILGVGAIIKKPVVAAKDGGDIVEIRPMMGLTLCFDHRMIDGAPAARFLQRLKHVIENPMLLLN